MQSAKKQPGPRKTGPGKGGNYEYLYKKADMYRLVRDCAEQLPFPVPLPKIRRTHFGTTIAKNQHMWWRDGTTLYSAYLMEILDETILRVEVYEADDCIAAESICLKGTEVT